jgi:hypothetical protein
MKAKEHAIHDLRDEQPTGTLKCCLLCGVALGGQHADGCTYGYLPNDGPNHRGLNVVVASECEQPTDLMPRQVDDNHDTEDLQQGDFLYLDAGSLKLTIYNGCTVDALEKAQRFLQNLIAQRA